MLFYIHVSVEQFVSLISIVYIILRMLKMLFVNIIVTMYNSLNIIYVSNYNLQYTDPIAFYKINNSIAVLMYEWIDKDKHLCK